MLVVKLRTDKLTSHRDKVLIELVGEYWVRELPQIELECSGKSIVVPCGAEYVHLGGIWVWGGVKGQHLALRLHGEVKGQMQIMLE